MVADPLRLQRILLNILSNAVKFTPSGGSITLRVVEKSGASDGLGKSAPASLDGRAAGDVSGEAGESRSMGSAGPGSSGVPVRYGDYEFYVRDTGIGMSAEYQKHIFEQFSREETSTVSKTEGTGLGMPITKRLVEMMDGSIDLLSVQGQGTEFTVHLRLPLCGAPKTETPVANAFAEDRENALAAGMNEHIAKPFDIHTLLWKLAEILKK